MIVPFLAAMALATPAVPAPPAAVPAVPAVPAAAASEPLSRDDRGRPTIAVRVNGRGPFAMVVDTAAQTSLIVPAVADELGLAPLEGGVAVQGVTGAVASRLYPVDRFATALFDLRGAAMVALPNIGSTSARGIVGMDLFADRQLLFDRTAGRLSVRPSAPTGPGYVAVAGHADAAGFVRVPVTLDGVRVDATVDTGAAVTVAGAATLRALGWKADDPRLRTGGEIRGAAGGGRRVRVATIGRLTLGPVTLSGVPVIVSGDDDDGAGADGAPSILLGSDILNLLDAYAVDLARAELQIRIPGRRPDPAAPAR